MAQSNSNIAAVLDISHRRGDTFIREFTFEENGLPMDLTGWSCRMQVRETSSKPAVLDLSTDDDIEITGGDSNVVRITVSGARMQVSAKSYVWDLELESPTGIITTYLAGSFVITQDITQ